MTARNYVPAPYGFDKSCACRACQFIHAEEKKATSFDERLQALKVKLLTLKIEEASSVPLEDLQTRADFMQVLEATISDMENDSGVDNTP